MSVSSSSGTLSFLSDEAMSDLVISNRQCKAVMIRIILTFIVLSGWNITCHALLRLSSSCYELLGLGFLWLALIFIGPMLLISLLAYNIITVAWKTNQQKWNVDELYQWIISTKQYMEDLTAEEVRWLICRIVMAIQLWSIVMFGFVQLHILLTKDHNRKESSSSLTILEYRILSALLSLSVLSCAGMFQYCVIPKARDEIIDESFFLFPDEASQVPLTVGLLTPGEMTPILEEQYRTTGSATTGNNHRHHRSSFTPPPPIVLDFRDIEQL